MQAGGPSSSAVAAADADAAEAADGDEVIGGDTEGLWTASHRYRIRTLTHQNSLTESYSN